MSNKNEPKQKTVQARTANQTPEAHPKHEANDSKIDREEKTAEGRVQEDLAPIRRSAGHAHTH